MRGAPAIPAGIQSSSGIIPADAGSTPSEAPPCRKAGDHPRGCGEHSTVTAPLGFPSGSSPRMRGALAVDPGARLLHGIIPADAGSTLCPIGVMSSTPDHPRGCGEHPVQGKGDDRRAGSSPRMRGARYCVARLWGQAGIIPADAGSTRSIRPSAHAAMDHPRGCGEHRLWNRYHKFVKGSSPRMRGARMANYFVDFPARIIPADAGSTGQRINVAHGSGDHPRGCGEHIGKTYAWSRWAGSSPRMRGARSGRRQSHCRWRIIPADVGSTSLMPTTRPDVRDHPRRCGEHTRRYGRKHWFLGSSPRMRGAHFSKVSQSLSDRIIPADAGSTILSTFQR